MAYFVVWDEVSSCEKGLGPQDAWQSVIQPCIVTRWSEQNALRFDAPSPGRALIISTPKGFNFFHEMYSYGDSDPLWKSYHFDYKDSPFLDPKEIERIRHTIDKVKFAAEYLALFKESGNNVFYMFDRKKHIRKDLEEFEKSDNLFEKGEDVHCCIDFNIGIQATSFFALRGDQMHFLDETSGHPDTETLALAIKAKYPNHKIYAYPDPSGKARKSSAPVGRTDFSILQSHGITVLAHPKAPPIVDSANAVNRMLENAAGETRIFIHPRCVDTIKSLERTKWVDKNPDTATIDKSEGIEHWSDGIRYAVEYLFPVEGGRKRVARGFGF